VRRLSGTTSRLFFLASSGQQGVSRNRALHLKSCLGQTNPRICVYPHDHGILAELTSHLAKI